MGRVTAAAAALMSAVADGVKQATGAAQNKSETAPASDPYTKATDDLRTAAKWLLGAFAAVGALFGAGVQLTGAGDLTKEMPSRLAAAGIGFLLVVGGIVLAIYATAKVLRVDYLTLDDILDKSHLSRLNRNTALVEPFDSVTELRTTLDNLRPQLRAGEERLRKAKAAQQQLPPDDTATEQEKGAARDAAKELREARGDMAELQSAYGVANSARSRAFDAARLLDVRHRFADSANQAVLGAVLTAVGLLSFVWGANPPDPGTLPTAEVLPQTPTEVKFLLTDAGRAKYKDALGGVSCKTEGVLEGIAMSVSGQEYRVASKQTAGCTSTWMVLGPELARVSPAGTSEKESESPTATASPTPTEGSTATATATPTPTSATK